MSPELLCDKLTSAWLFQDQVNKGGFYSEHPDLEDLDNGDLKYTMDYRAVYEYLLSQWFGIKSNHFERFRDTRLQGFLS